MKRISPNCLLLLIVMAMHTLSIKAQVLTIDSCLSLARQNNKELRHAELNIEKAQQVKNQAFTNYFPQVKATAIGYHSLHPMVEVGIDDINNCISDWRSSTFSRSVCKASPAFTATCTVR